MDPGSAHVPIGEYGAIGNDERCALVSRDGSIDWLCLPHLESPSAFAAVLDADDGGRFAVAPAEDSTASFGYVDRTNVLRTTFETIGGTAALTDVMPVGDGEPPHEDYQKAVYRRVEGIEGAVDLEVRFEPRFDYARADTSVETEERDGGVAAVATGDGDRLALFADDLAFDVDGGSATASVTVEEGETRWLRLQYGEFRPTAEEAERALEGSIDYWREWIAGCEEAATGVFSFDEFRDALVRSALVLKLLIHEGTGSIPAAPTTSLPEEIGGRLNWDYRYNWIRDANFAVQALYNVGQTEEASGYFEWFREIGHEEPAEIRPIYDLHGGSDLEERTLDHLSGYRNSRPVRIGNAAADQFQLDVYGTIVQGIYETIRYENGLSTFDWESIRALADHVCAVWDRRDAGIWEFREHHRHFVHSKLLAWVALDRAIHLAEEYDRDGPLARWEREREEIREAILERGYEESIGSFVQHFETDEAIDATALLIPVYDFLPPDDDRVRSTIETIREELTADDGLVHRFANSDARPREDGAFLLCSFWLVDALALSGRLEEARDVFETALERANPLGLLSEMVLPDGTLLGNYPQAFSHIGLINSALYLASASDEAEGFPPDELSDGAAAPLFRRHDS